MISSCSTCSGDASLEIAKLMQSAYTEQNRISEALAVQNITLQIDASAAEGIAEQIDISV